MNKKVRVLIAEDNCRMRGYIASRLSSSNRVEVVGEVDCGRDVLRLVEEKSPDVLTLDMMLPDVNGDEVICLLREKASQVRILAISGYYSQELVSHLFDLGADAYLCKDDVFKLLPEAVIKVAEGYSGWIQ